MVSVLVREAREPCVRVSALALWSEKGGVCVCLSLVERVCVCVRCVLSRNHLKEHAKRVGLEYFLTYADNHAIGYFQKLGFSQVLTLPEARWRGYIKDYDGGTLMECKVHPKVDYLNLDTMRRAARDSFRERTPEMFGEDFCERSRPLRCFLLSQLPISLFLPHVSLRSQRRRLSLTLDLI